MAAWVGEWEWAWWAQFQEDQEERWAWADQGEHAPWTRDRNMGVVAIHGGKQQEKANNRREKSELWNRIKLIKHGLGEI